MIHNLDIKDFLQNFWQKKPLLIRSAFPNYKSPITAEELAGLACEEFIESRIIIEKNKSPKWELENGPFSESRFTTLPKTHWTLLIQGLNKVFPEFDDLLHEFNFIPSWRVDDLMGSYAAPEGSVGPHIDQYDVFLLQAKGRRKWMISEEHINDDNFESDIPLKIIKDFNVESEWILEAGDMLYLPANVAHYGIGMDDCMTFSIGFRAPSHSELLSAYVDEHITDLKDNLRYRDPALLPDLNSGEISPEVIKNIQNILISQFNDTEKIQDWFGRFITDYLNNDENLVENNVSATKFQSDLKETGVIRRPASVRANYLINKNKTVSLFINGIKQDLISETDSVVKLFCNQHINTYEDLEPYLNNENSLNFLCDMYNNGYLEFPDE